LSRVRLADTRCVQKRPDYPSEPKSTAHVRAGEFWGIPLRLDGWYACDRVLTVWDSRVNQTAERVDACQSGGPQTR
jgi:hypothetical protein